jgi:hypothetical protein
MMRTSGAALAMLLAAALSISGCGNANRKAGSGGNGGNAGNSVPGDIGAIADSAAVPESGARTRAAAKVRIRLHNLDSVALTDVQVRWPADSAHFDSIGAKAHTAYVAVDTAYGYAYIEAKAGKRTWICQPTDFVGETPLAPGHYTYEISPAAVLDEKNGTSLGFLRLDLLVDKEHP